MHTADSHGHVACCHRQPMAMRSCHGHAMMAKALVVRDAPPAATGLMESAHGLG
eukprot:COSAG01_NODE_2037_length_8579_cov_119.860849_7_plen_54_part_00